VDPAKGSLANCTAKAKPGEYSAGNVRLARAAIWRCTLIGVAIMVILFARREKIPIFAVGDAVAFVVPWGLMFGRLGNWVNGELWGRMLPKDMQAAAPWWSVKYPRELELFNGVPAALEPLRDLAPATLRANDAKFIQWLIETAYDHSSAAHAQVIKTITPLLNAYYPSQFFQAFAE
jgi:prolipoprotein diacylglyceryltransferase